MLLEAKYLVVAFCGLSQSCCCWWNEKRCLNSDLQIEDLSKCIFQLSLLEINWKLQGKVRKQLFFQPALRNVFWWQLCQEGNKSNGGKKPNQNQKLVLFAVLTILGGHSHNSWMLKDVKTSHFKKKVCFITVSVPPGIHIINFNR